jgi:hypothetical protein
MWESGSHRSRRPNTPTINARTMNVLTRPDKYCCLEQPLKDELIREVCRCRYCGVAVIGIGAFFGVLR